MKSEINLPGLADGNGQFKSAGRVSGRLMRQTTTTARDHHEASSGC